MIDAIQIKSDFISLILQLNWIEILKASTPFVAVLIFILGNKTYRSQKMWDRKVELAGQCMAILYDAKYQLKQYRSQFSFSVEGEAYNTVEQELIDRFKPRDQHKFLVNYRKHQSVMENLYNPCRQLMPKMVAAFGRDADAPLSSIVCIIKDISIAKSETASPDLPEKDSELRKDQIKSQRYYLDISGWTENDAIEQFVDSVCASAETNMRRYLEHDGFRYPWFYKNWRIIGEHKPGRPHFWPIYDKPNEETPKKILNIPKP